MGAKGHIKGPCGEREVVHLIKPWWQQHEPGALFTRTPQSGGWLDEEHRTEFKTSGDLMSNSTIWPFGVEVKWREAWSEDEFYGGRPSPVWEWWRQCQRDAYPSRQEPMLWYRRNRRPWMVLLRDSFVSSLFRGRATDSLPSSLCSLCVKPREGLCACVHPRPGSGCLGDPFHKWHPSLVFNINCGAPPVAFQAADLLKVHPSRFLRGQHPACPIGEPTECPMCGAPSREMRGKPYVRRCSRRNAGCPWEHDATDGGSAGLIAGCR